MDPDELAGLLKEEGVETMRRKSEKLGLTLGRDVLAGILSAPE